MLWLLLLVSIIVLTVDNDGAEGVVVLFVVAAVVIVVEYDIINSKRLFFDCFVVLTSCMKNNTVKTTITTIIDQRFNRLMLVVVVSVCKRRLFHLQRRCVNNMEDLTDDFLPRQPCTYCAVYDLSLNNQAQMSVSLVHSESAMVVLRRVLFERNASQKKAKREQMTMR